MPLSSPEGDFARDKDRLGVIDDVRVLEPFRMRIEKRLQDFHVVRTADEDRVVVARPVPQEGLEQRRAVPIMNSISAGMSE